MTAASFLLAAQAQAHRFGGPNDPCERRIGPSLIHITLYQPQFDPDAEYCNEVPREGKTVLVVDILGDELRRVPMGLELIAIGNSRDSHTILSVPPKVYKRGVADTEVVLTEGNDYVARVILEDGAGGNPQALSFSDSSESMVHGPHFSRTNRPGACCFGGIVHHALLLHVIKERGVCFGTGG